MSHIKRKSCFRFFIQVRLKLCKTSMQAYALDLEQIILSYALCSIVHSKGFLSMYMLYVDFCFFACAMDIFSPDVALSFFSF